MKKTVTILLASLLTVVVGWLGRAQAQKPESESIAGALDIPKERAEQARRIGEGPILAVNGQLIRADDKISRPTPPILRLAQRGRSFMKRGVT